MRGDAGQDGEELLGAGGREETQVRGVSLDRQREVNSASCLSSSAGCSSNGASRSSQEWVPKANGGPADPQGHLQLLRGHHVVYHQNRLLRAVRQREHRHLRAGNGQAGDELRIPPSPAHPFFFLSLSLS